METPKIRIPVLVVGLFLLIFALQTDAQTEPNPVYENGLKNFGSFSGEDIDSVNILNGQLNLRIPLISFPQRGGKLHLGFFMDYKSQDFSFYHSTGCNSAGCAVFHSTWPGVQIKPDFVVSAVYFPNVALRGVVDSTNSIRDVAGTSAGGYPLYYATTDGSAYKVEINNNGSGGNEIITITDHDGISNVEGYSTFKGYEDANGNRITETYVVASGGSGAAIQTWTDTMGRGIPAPGNRNLCYPSCWYSGVLQYGPNADYMGWVQTPDFSGCTGTLPTSAAYLWTLPALGTTSSTMQFKMCYANVTINVPGICGADPICVFSGPSVVPRLQSVLLPDGKSWVFTYDSATPNVPTSVGYGDLLQVTSPTGGTFAYTYRSFTSSPICYTPTTTSPQDSAPQYSLYSFTRAVATRTLNANDGQGPQTWTYSPIAISGANDTTLTEIVIDPLNNQTVYSMSALAYSPSLTPNSCFYYETNRQYYQGSSTSGTLVKSVHTDYVHAIQDGTSNLWPPLPSRYTTTLSNGQQAKIELGYEFPLAGSISDGNIATRAEYDYGPTSPGPLLRTTTTTYLGVCRR